MSRKDYKAIAHAIHDARVKMDMIDPGAAKEEAKVVLDDMTNRIADHLQTDNPAFSRHRFLSAVGIV